MCEGLWVLTGMRRVVTADVAVGATLVERSALVSGLWLAGDFGGQVLAGRV